MYLFIDTTQDITVGLIDSSFNWLSYEYFQGKKGSAVIHQIIHEQLIKVDGVLKDIQGLIQIAGPGSYTGMRVSDGISQIFDWQKFNTYSIYHFEVPKLLGVTKGHWIANAFKGELFDYFWDYQHESKNLVKKDEFIRDSDFQYFTSFNTKEDFEDIQLTSQMIKDNIQEVMNKVLNNKMKRSLYYYRDIEQEYSRKEK